MSIQSIIKRLELRGIFANSSSVFVPPSESAVESLLGELAVVVGGAIPNDYSEFIKHFSHAISYSNKIIKVQGVQLSSFGSDETDFGVVMGAAAGGLNVVSATKDWHDGAYNCVSLPHHIVVGECSAGHPFILDVTLNGAVYYFDMWAAGSENIDPQNFRYKIAENFTEFLELLLEESPNA